MHLMLALLPILCACTGADPDGTLPTVPTTPATVSDTVDSALQSTPGPVLVVVTLDGTPIEATVQIGGAGVVEQTDAMGQAVLDAVRDGTEVVIAGHPDARTLAATVPVGATEVQVDLVRFDPSDNLDYSFQHPGTPTNRDTTDLCAHCHVTINDDWYGSLHRTSASNPVVQDIYAGAAAALTDVAACTAAGGRWWSGLEPGTGAAVERCYVGWGTLPDLDPACGDSAPCDGVATQTGACADCHAPGIDGVLGGRDLLEATGHAYDFGVHCDVCHKVASVDLSAAAGVAGRLRIQRPPEPSTLVGLDYQPLQFGPYGDVPNPRMGAVGRDLFRSAELCAGCHQLEQAVLVPGQIADPIRWPDGLLPIHSTYQEWLDGPYSPQSPCQSCHMPPDPSVGNSADLGNEFVIEPGVAGGWPRPPGAVRRHSWPGPRRDEPDLLATAAAVDIDEVLAGSDLTVQVTVTNTGCGHALPTGEPMRSVLLRVEATCGGVPVAPAGGDVLPAWAGALAAQPASGDWTRWPGAEPGDRIRVVQWPGLLHDYEGPGPFGDGTFGTTEKGLPVELWAGEAEVLSVVGDVVTLDSPLPPGAMAYRVPALTMPTDGSGVAPWAGAPGFAFARVLADGDGAVMVPHHRAVDVVSDNRLRPLDTWSSTHQFTVSCADPEVHAVLVHRAAPWSLADQRQWASVDQVLVEVRQ